MARRPGPNRVTTGISEPRTLKGVFGARPGQLCKQRQGLACGCRGASGSLSEEGPQCGERVEKKEAKISDIQLRLPLNARSGVKLKDVNLRLE